MNEFAEADAPVVLGRLTERRIQWLTPLFGLAGAGVAVALRRPDWAIGLAIGAGLGWLNFRWLKRGLDALVLAAQAQQGRKSPQVPLATYFTAVFRYGLLALVIYVIFDYLHVPLGSMVVGLCALGAATLAASVWEILRPPTGQA
ncbi:MAG TPA: ATP synthase subunit I [Dongiaceae bacterium]|nr:ATP synthase subunit I [Dongiaceae bacterium]